VRARRKPRASVRTALAAATLLLGCGADFVETAPPDLARATTEYVASSVPEPLVWMVVADLYLENPADCPAALAYLDASIKAAMPAAPLSMDLGRVTVSPCTQSIARTLDPALIDGAVHRAELAFPGHAVRAVLLYVNNLALAPPAQITDALLAARSRIHARSGLFPRIWTSIPSTAPRSAIPADHTVPWGYVGDPSYAAALAKSFQQAVPFVTDAAVQAGPMPLLAAGDLSRARALKVCRADDGISGMGFALDGSTVEIDAGRPPQYRVALNPRFAMEQTGFEPLRVRVESEVCLDHCDRFFEYEPGGNAVRWSSSPHCLLKGASR